LPRNKLFIMSLVGTVLACVGVSAGQPPWSGVLAPSRAINWSTAGATITNRTTACTTQPALLAGSGNAAANLATLNIAIAAAITQANCVVNIPAGTWYVGGSLLIESTSGGGNFTLRGAGANQTFLVFTSTNSNCNGNGQTPMCIWSKDGIYLYGIKSPSASWSSGYSQGTTTVTLSTVSGLKVGMQLILYQADPASDTGNIWSCQTTGSNGDCSEEGSHGIAIAGNGESETKIVASCGASAIGAACTSTSVTLATPIEDPNFSSSQAPGAAWGSYLPITGVGIENLSSDFSGAGSLSSGMFFSNAHNCWVMGVRSINNTVSGASANSHIALWLTTHSTVRDSYMYGSNPASGGYGTDAVSGAADNLFENNIYQHMASGMQTEGCNGCVFGYNYAVDLYFGNSGSTWQIQDSDHHSVGDAFNLYEGNESPELEADTIHGTAWMLTDFRNYRSGHALNDEFCGTPGCMIQATFAYADLAFSRYFNVVGDVLGSTGYQTTYTTQSASASDCGSMSKSSVSIFVLGYSDQGGVNYSPSCLDTTFTIPNDSLVAATLMRWGNYDTVTSAVRWCGNSSNPGWATTCSSTSEVPTTAPVYPNPVPSGTTLPPSFYLSSKPAFWNSAIPWPSAGPDVSATGSLAVAGVGGHVYLDPAANCYLNVMGGAVDGSSGTLTFNPASCYYISGGAPQAPSGLQATVN
jgi:hypothetical protein